MDMFAAAAAALTVVLAFCVWATFVLLRQNGRLLLRVDALEARIGSAPPEAAGLPRNTPAPRFSLGGLDGETVVLDGLIERGKPVVLVFAEPGCSACETIFSEVAQWQQAYEAHLTIALISRGKPAANRNRRDSNGLRNVLLQADREVADAYRVIGSPSAVLIRDGKVAGALAEGADAIRRLIVRANLPPPLPKGAPVPSLELSDLDGTILDLATLRGRNTLVLFWDSANGQCQLMVPDIKTQERVRLAQAPELLLIASGPADAIRAHGFTSRTLLDPHLEGRSLFGAEITPTTVLIDADGRVASDLGEGYVAAFEHIGLVPFVPSDDTIVAAMLRLADVRSDDVVYDLGCGDGRVVVAAAKTFGARGVGVDIDPERLEEARANAREAGVEHLVTFEEHELFSTDLRDATVVTMYLLPKVNLQLRPKLLAELKPGTRVVSHAFDMDDWKPDREQQVDSNAVFLWTIRAVP